ncbi:MAG TPA: GNAT family N-acetyltransferase [Gemmatimonadaceae bacterium]|nr:GNAT family N-acetyltransferase [Gemmatimonadaceae bacterium]
MPNGSEPFAVRRAGPADASAIARLHIASWRAAYRAELPPAFLAALDETQRTQQWHERLEVPTTEVLLADRAGQVTGFCAHGPANAAHNLTSAWEIYGLHVAPDLRGTGIGTQLFGAACDRAREKGAAQLTLWVVATNAPARRFYEAKGMRPDGVEKQRELIPGVVLHEVRYTVSLG